MYTVLDFETTGLDHTKEQVIEIGAVKLDKNMKQIGSLHLMVRLHEGKELPEFITKLTGITPADIENANPEYAAMHQLTDFIDTDIVIAQFASFDLGFLSRYFLPQEFICTRTMSQLLNPKKKASLANLVERYGVQLTDPHRAFADVLATAEVFKIMREQLDMKGIEYKNVMLTSAERPLRFVPANAKVIELA